MSVESAALQNLVIYVCTYNHAKEGAIHIVSMISESCFH
jgi:hypothetical protein